MGDADWTLGDDSPTHRPPLISSSISRPSSVLSTTSTSSFTPLPPALVPPSPLGDSLLPSVIPFLSSPTPPIAFPTTREAQPKDAMLINPRHALMRSRRVSLPANLVQTNYHSIVGGGAVGAGVAAQNRMSVASVSSFESLAEEGEDVDGSKVGEDEPKAAGSPRPSLRPRLSRRPASPTPTARLSIPPTSRNSLPTPPAYHGAYQSFAIPPAVGRTSPLARSQSYSREQFDLGRKPSREEKDKRADRRWRIALELRETERSYLGVLNEIDREYYQPLLAALPVSDLAARRAARSTSTPTSPILGPTRSDSTLAPILSRKEIGEVFSNFTDVVTLSHVMLATLDEVVPDRPSDPVAIFTAATLGSATPELSSSTDTVDSAGPGTPEAARAPDSPERKPSLADTKREKRPLPPPVRLGKALLPVLPFLKSYSLFIANFSSALGRLSALEAQVDGADGGDEWRAFCEERRRRGVAKGLGLSGLLLNIVQRVPRYRYLLGDMLRYTERDHPDFKDLTAAFDIVDKVANHLEAEIHAHANVLEMLDLQRAFSNLDAPLLAPGRRLLKSGLLRKLDRRGNDQVRTFFLFNDILIHASGSTWAGVVHAPEPSERPRSAHNRNSVASSAASGAPMIQYRFHRRFALEDVTVVGLEDAPDDTGRKFGFEILSPEKSFALYADSLEMKQEWMSAIRDASSNLLRDRRTLQRDVDSQPVRDRRISLPSSPGPLRALASPRPKTSLPPSLDSIPYTPLVDSPSLIVGGLGTDYAFPRVPSPAPPESEKPSQPERVRRWSDVGSTLAPGVVVECRVIENYSAPVWVPDSKAERCMTCAEAFGVWRRRHHCRLCGSVVCWACSTKTFVIPSQDDAALDRLARACDVCYENVFGELPHPELHQLPSLQATTPMLGPHASGSHIFVGAPFSPSPDVSLPPTPGIVSQIEESKERGGAAVKSLASILSR